jgi:hypothetical protein
MALQADRDLLRPMYISSFFFMDQGDQIFRILAIHICSGTFKARPKLARLRKM